MWKIPCFSRQYFKQIFLVDRQNLSHFCLCFINSGEVPSLVFFPCFCHSLRWYRSPFLLPSLVFPRNKTSSLNPCKPHCDPNVFISIMLNHAGSLPCSIYLQQGKYYKVAQLFELWGYSKHSGIKITLCHETLQWLRYGKRERKLKRWKCKGYLGLRLSPQLHRRVKQNEHR